jgi:hypothetical protein
MLRAGMSEVKFKVRLNALLLREFTTEQIMRITGLKPESVRTELQRMKAEDLLEVARGAAPAGQKRLRGGQPVLYRLTSDPEKRLALSRSVEAFYPEVSRPLHPTSRHYHIALKRLDQAAGEKDDRKRLSLLAETEDELDFALLEEGASRAPESVQAHIELQTGRLAYLRGQDERAEGLLRQARQALSAVGQTAEAGRADEFLLCIAVRRRWTAGGDYRPETRARCLLELLDSSGFRVSSPLIELLAGLLGEKPQPLNDQIISAVSQQAVQPAVQPAVTVWRETGRMEERLSQREPRIWELERQERLERPQMPDLMRPSLGFERTIFAMSQDLSFGPRRQQRHDD